LSLYRILRRVFSVGRGFNEYNKRKEKVYILRWNFPNKVRRVELSYVFSELLSLEIESQKQLLNPIELNLYLLLKDQRKIVLIRPVIENINSLKKIERFSASLAKFLQVPLKNLFVEVSFIKIFIEIVRLILKKVQFFIKK
jgi:hypothetical protein